VSRQGEQAGLVLVVIWCAQPHTLRLMLCFSSMAHANGNGASVVERNAGGESTALRYADSLQVQVQVQVWACQQRHVGRWYVRQHRGAPR